MFKEDFLIMIYEATNSANEKSIPRSMSFLEMLNVKSHSTQIEIFLENIFSPNYTYFLLVIDYSKEKETIHIIDFILKM
jgi:hypothetical protein